MKEKEVKQVNENLIEGRNAVMEAFRAGKPIDKLFVLNLQPSIIIFPEILLTSVKIPRLLLL